MKSLSKTEKLIALTEGMSTIKTFKWLWECLLLYKFNVSVLIEKEYDAMLAFQRMIKLDKETRDFTIPPS